MAQRLVQQLADWDVGHVFLVPGLQIDPLNRALAAHAGLQAIVACHELGAGYMADGYARARGRLGVVFAIGGPGCANLAGAAVSARADGVPLLLLTGNIPQAAQGRGEFQDGGPAGANDAALAAAAAGTSLTCADAGELALRLAQVAARLAGGEPVHLGLSHQVQRQPVEAGPVPWPQPREDEGPAPAGARLPALDEARAALAIEPRVALVAGAGAVAVADELVALARALHLPLLTDLAARGLIDETAPEAAGHLGFMPHPRALAVLQPGPLQARQLVYVGSARALQRWRGRHGQVDLPVLHLVPGLLAAWRATAAAPLPAAMLAARQAWGAALRVLERPPAVERAAGTGLGFVEAVDALAAALPAATRWVVDAGQVRRIAAMRLQCRQPGTLFIAEGMAPMGWSLGAAIGVALADPGRTVVALLGDGAMRMHGIELATAARYRLPILYVLFDNAAHGSVLQRMATPAEREQALLPAVDWLAFASAFGVGGARVAHLEGLREALRSPRPAAAPWLLVLRVPAVEPDAYREPTGIDWQLDEPVD